VRQSTQDIFAMVGPGPGLSSIRSPFLELLIELSIHYLLILVDIEAVNHGAQAQRVNYASAGGLA
jgi:hypothetical protein